MPERRPRALVTGGAGLIGSHVADLLLAEGWAVRVLDSLEPTTHRGRVPGWIDALKWSTAAVTLTGSSPILTARSPSVGASTG